MIEVFGLQSKHTVSALSAISAAGHFVPLLHSYRRSSSEMPPWSKTHSVRQDKWVTTLTLRLSMEGWGLRGLLPDPWTAGRRGARVVLTQSHDKCISHQEGPQPLKPWAGGGGQAHNEPGLWAGPAGSEAGVSSP